MTSIKELTEMVLAFRDERNWKQYHTAKNIALSIIIELGELFELFQWEKLDEIENKIKDDDYHTRFEEELADVAIYLLILAHELGVDLEKAIPEKIKKNELKYPPP
ncbi:MAG: nucleotide pyrophosphohydrolase [Candidatus Heimdallarchaeaceae archaeon]